MIGYLIGAGGIPALKAINGSGECHQPGHIRACQSCAAEIAQRQNAGMSKLSALGARNQEWAIRRNQDMEVKAQRADVPEDTW